MINPMTVPERRGLSRPAAMGWIILVFLAAALACPFWGPTSVNWTAAFSGTGSDAQVFLDIRVPRVAMALLTGASLSVAGVAFQALLGNPLADPFTLGVAGGSSLGAVAALLLLPSLSAQFTGTVPLAAFLGGLASVALVYGLARAARGPETGAPLSPAALLLAGITVNYFFNALILLAFYAVDFSRSTSLMRWILGGLDVADRSALAPAFWPSAAAFLALWLLSPALNLLSGGEEIARSKGVNLRATILWTFLAASVLTSSVTAFTGPIGFIGLMVPHAARKFLGHDHRWLLPGSALLGGAFLALADTAARTWFAPAELPVAALTALLGGPFFLFLLFRQFQNKVS